MVSIEAEQSVIGALMLDEAAWDRCAHLVRAADFYRADHRAIFSAIASLVSQQRPTDPLSVMDRLKEQGALDLAGGQKYLGELAKNCAGTYNVAAYAETVAKRAVLRRVYSAYQAAEEDFNDGDLSIDQRAHRAVARITDALDEASCDNAIPLVRESAREWVEYLERTSNNGGGMVGMPTGFADLDDALKGLCPGELIVIGARPSMGKSALALNICANVAEAGHGVFITSLEMPKTAIFNRLAAYVQKVPYEAVRMAKMDEIGPHIAAFGSKLQRWNMAIDDRPNIDLSKLEAALRHHKRKHGLSLAMVDYLGLMNMPDGQNRAQAIGDLTRGLKNLAGSLNIPILLLAQLNRELEKRQDKRPIMADLRDSGAIEQDAHTILFLYRDEVYNENTDQKGIAELIIGKARDAERGVKIPLHDDLSRMGFRNIDRRYYANA